MRLAQLKPFEKLPKRMNNETLNEEPLRLVHHHPGYLRAQAKIFSDPQKSEAALTQAKTLAEGTPGFRKWSHSAKTGSFVIQYSPGTLDVDQLAEKIASVVGLSGVIMDIHSSSHRKEMINSLLQAVEDLNDIVYLATGKKADLRELIPAGLLLNSIVAFALGKDRGSRMPSWDSSLYRSYRIFMQTHKKELSKRDKKRNAAGRKKKKKNKKDAEEGLPQ